MGLSRIFLISVCIVSCGSLRLFARTARSISLIEIDTEERLNITVSTPLVSSIVEDAHVLLAADIRNNIGYFMTRGSLHAINIEDRQVRELGKIGHHVDDSPSSIDLDWITGQFYVGVQGDHDSSGRIEVCSISDVSNCAVVLFDGLDYLYSLVVNPSEGLMYWQNGISNSVESAYMNGSNHDRTPIETAETMFAQQNIRLTSLTFHPPSQRMFFVRSLGSANEIVACHLTGSRSCQVQAVADDIIHLAVSEKYLIWSMSVHGSLMYCTIDNCQETKQMVKVAGVETFVVLDPALQPHKNKHPNPCARRNFGCSHYCLLTHGRPHASCACPIGIALEKDGRTCQKKGIDKMLLISALNGLYKISLDTSDLTSIQIKYEGHEQGQKLDGVEFDQKTKFVYWLEGLREEPTSSVFGKVVKRCLINGSNTKVILTVPTNVKAIKIDPPTQNLYWLEEGITSRIGMTSLSTFFSKTIILNGLRGAKAFALNYEKRIIVVASDREDYGIIEQFSLDGKNRTRILSLPQGHFVISIDFDVKANKVYWTESNSTQVAWLDLNEGIAERIDFPPSIRLAQPNIVSVLEETIFFNSFAERYLLKMVPSEADEADKIEVSIFGSSGMKAISMFNNDIKKDVCSVSNGGCQHICTSNYALKPVCLCADGFALKDDGISCTAFSEMFFMISGRGQNFLEIVTSGSLPQTNNFISNYNDVFKKILCASVDNFQSELIIAGISVDGYGTIAKALIPSVSNYSVVTAIPSITVLLSESSLNGVVSIAVDQTSRNIFWTNAHTNRVEVCDMTGQFRRALAWKNTYPRQMVLSSTQKAIFYVNAAKNVTIRKLPMSGDVSGGVDIITELENILSLSIDEQNSQIYWVENNDVWIVSVALLDGKQREILYVGKDRNPLDISFYNNLLYFIENSGSADTPGVLGNYDGMAFKSIHSNMPHISSFKLHQRQEKPNKKIDLCGWETNRCKQLCLPKERENERSFFGFEESHSEMCTCSDHFFLESSAAVATVAAQCKPIAQSVFAVTHNGISMLSLHRLADKSMTWRQDPITRLPLKFKRSTVISSISYHSVFRTLFWIEQDDPTSIKTASVDHPYERLAFNSLTSSHCNFFVALAVDDVGNQLYTTCYRSSTGFVAVYSISNSPILLKYIGIVVSGDAAASATGIPTQPRAIIVVPLKNIFFYVDKSGVAKQGTSSIVKCSLDGKKCINWLTEGVSANTKLQAELNIESSRLFYTSKTGVWSRDIASATSHVRHHYSSQQGTTEYAVAPLDEVIVLVADIHKQKSFVIDLLINETIPALTDTYLLTITSTLEAQSKTCRESGCSHMCRYAREKDAPIQEKFECLCPIGFALSSESSKICVPSVTCEPWQFSCADGQQCVHAAKKCDRVNDCNDHSDETSSQCSTVGEGWPCDDGTSSVNRTFVCDGFTHCPDASDELHCRCERPHENFDCGAWSSSNSKKCVPRISMCNQNLDCELGEDESALVCFRFSAIQSNAGWLYSVLLAIVILLILILVMFCCARQAKAPSPTNCTMTTDRNEASSLLPSTAIPRPPQFLPDQVPLHSYSVTNSSSTCIALPPPNSSWTASKISSSAEIPPHRFYAPPPSTASLSTYGVVRPTDIRMIPRSSHTRRRRTQSPDDSSVENVRMTSTPRNGKYTDSPKMFDTKTRPSPIAFQPIHHSSTSSLSSHSSDENPRY
ncbi:unnamed protein product [Caenorhabditis auriculariae]|uniref:EGF-like domain-containing protein n=1 Tax=Caenorhabditis auriculariae TaxID=2777116 RepID=A0A8S1GRH3_9PELO|nr:unnamed protein product [Caenorhabditis auriculariae]